MQNSVRCSSMVLVVAWWWEEDREADVHATRGLGLLLLGRPHSTRTLPNSPEITDEQPSPEVQSNRQFLITDAKG
jgi:hypothetical protein